MLDISAPDEIPNRALFKAAEVCEILKVQPYVLRSWEAEFPDLGVAKTAGGPRVYRRRDVEQVARIRRLLLVDGLTLAGARRKLEEDGAPVVADALAMDELIGQNARERLTTIKRGLRSILEMLEAAAGTVRTPAPPAVRLRAMPAGRTKTSRGQAAGARGAARARSARRKRPA